MHNQDFAIHEACKSGLVCLVKYLLERPTSRAQMNKPNSDGVSNGNLLIALKSHQTCMKDLPIHFPDMDAEMARLVVHNTPTDSWSIIVGKFHQCIIVIQFVDECETEREISTIPCRWFNQRGYPLIEKLL